MEIYFNELSIKNLSQITYLQIEKITGAYKELRNEGVNTCRIESEDNNHLVEMIKNLKNGWNILNFYFSFFKSPFESDYVDQNQEDYFKYQWNYNNIDCIGPAIAYILDSICFSLYQDEWETEYFDIYKNQEIVHVRNVSNDIHVYKHKDFLESKKPVELVKSKLSFNDKKIDLRDDHGKDVLLEFSKKIVRCPYIDAVINSLPFNPCNRKFIRRRLKNLMCWLNIWKKN